MQQEEEASIEVHFCKGNPTRIRRAFSRWMRIVAMMQHVQYPNAANQGILRQKAEGNFLVVVSSYWASGGETPTWTPRY